MSNYSIVTSDKDYTTKANALAKRGYGFAKDFSHFVAATVAYFHGGGNRNVELLNGLLSIAYDTRGMNAGHLADYLAVTVPHKMARDTEKKNRFVFTGKKKDATYPEALDVEAFLALNPNWATWNGGAAKQPKDFNPIEATDRFIARMMEKAKLNPAAIISLVQQEAARLEAVEKAKAA